MGVGSSLDRRIHSLFKRGVLDGNLSVLGTLTSSGALAVTGALSLTGNAVIASTALTGTGLLINKVANTGPTVKAHCHQLAASSTVVGDQVVANEFKGEFLDTIGTMDGIASHFRMSADGTGIMRAVLGVAYLDSGKTMSGTDYTTESWLVGGCFVSNASGILNGAGVCVAGLYGGISSCVGSTLTAAKYVASIWADSNRLVALSSGLSALILATNQTGAVNVDYGIRIESAGLLSTGISISGATTNGLKIEDATLSITVAKTFASATLESQIADLVLITDSTFLTGDDITYSSARGSSILKLVGTWTGASGGFEGIDLKIATSGALTAAGSGVVGAKVVVTNTAAITDGSIYGGQFIAKHNHATNDMSAQAALIGLEVIAYNAAAGDVGTAFGLNVIMRNYGAGGAGSVHAGIQVVLDQADGTKATEATGIRVWNMAGSWDAVLRVTGAFGVFANFDDATTCFAAITGAATTIAGQILVTMANGNTGYVNVYSTTGA
jgi:hypothetical protein